MSEAITVEILTQLLSRAPGASWSFRVEPATREAAWIYIDSRAAELYDVPEAELRAAPSASMQHVAPEDRARVDDAVAQSFQTLAPIVWAGQVVRRTGDRRWLEVHLAFEREASGSILVYGQMFDVTERKRLEQALTDADTELRQRNAELAASEDAKTRLIERLRYSIEELSTPILEVWDDVLVMPVIGVVDSRRTADMVQRLLAEVARRQANYVIVDLTGVEIVDTRTADHLMKLIRKVEVVGARCVLTGIRPAVAETLVEIGVDFGRITTLRNLKHGLREAIRIARREHEGAQSDRGAAHPEADDLPPQRRAR